MNATCHDNVAAFFGVKINISNGKQIFNLLSRSAVQWGSEIWTSLDFKWSKRCWVANGLDFEWDLKSGSPTIIYVSHSLDKVGGP